MVRNTEFTVFDVETTGLSARGADRIVEIALVRVDSRGTVLDEYATLVNPRRDVGPTWIHGIRDCDVKRAPFFEEIVGDVLARMAGAVVTAHNASFDLGFLNAEMSRAQCRLPNIPYLCTMQLARKTIVPRLPSNRLEALCQYFRIPNTRAHSALADAQATARLLSVLLDQIEQRTQLSLAGIGIRGERLAREQWPLFPPSGKAHSR